MAHRKIQSRPDRCLASLLCFLCLAAAHICRAQTLPNSPIQITIATYNVNNFFDGYDNPYISREGTPPKTKAKLKTLAQALTDLNADVVVLQEVEAGGFLQQFLDTYLPDAGYATVVDQPSNDRRGISIAVISRIPIDRIISHRTFRFKQPADPEDPHSDRFARDLLRIDLHLPHGQLLVVYGLHLKSKLDLHADPQGQKYRLAEAQNARSIIQEETTHEQITRFIVLGDCNDAIDSPPLQTLRQTTEPLLTDSLAAFAGPARLTFHNQRYDESIDQILLSPALAPDLVPDSPKIFRGGPFEKASDHRPVRVTLKIAP